MERNYRHEYKYMISRSAAQLLKLRLPHFTKRDPHAGNRGQYTIRSLYFDDMAFTAFQDKVAGVDNRTKYRIRCYDRDSTFCRLERKEKKGDLTRKTGQTITQADADALQRCLCTGCPDHPEGLGEELRLLCVGSGYRPRVLVDYDRTPYQGSLWASFDAMIPVLEPDQVILEVKFDDFLPGYLSDVLGDIPKIPMAISKFALCLNLIS